MATIIMYYGILFYDYSPGAHYGIASKNTAVCIYDIIGVVGNRLSIHLSNRDTGTYSNDLITWQLKFLQLAYALEYLYVCVDSTIEDKKLRHNI